MPNDRGVRGESSGGRRGVAGVSGKSPSGRRVIFGRSSVVRRGAARVSSAVAGKSGVVLGRRGVSSRVLAERPRRGVSSQGLGEGSRRGVSSRGLAEGSRRKVSLRGLVEGVSAMGLVEGFRRWVVGGSRVRAAGLAFFAKEPRPLSVCARRAGGGQAGHRRNLCAGLDTVATFALGWTPSQPSLGLDSVSTLSSG